MSGQRLEAKVDEVNQRVSNIDGQFADLLARDQAELQEDDDGVRLICTSFV